MSAIYELGKRGMDYETATKYLPQHNRIILWVLLRSHKPIGDKTNTRIRYMYLLNNKQTLALPVEQLPSMRFVDCDETRVLVKRDVEVGSGQAGDLTRIILGRSGD